MSSLSTNLQLIDLVQGESASGAFTNWGDVADGNFAILERTVSEVTTKSVTTIDVTLTATEELNLLIKASGTLTGNRNIITSGRKGFWLVRNACTGAFTLTIKTSAGAGVVVQQGGAALVVCDGTDILLICDVSTTGTESLTNKTLVSPTITGQIMVDAMTLTVAVVTDKTYRIATKIPFAGTITETISDAASGTCNATTRIDGVAVGGAANAVSSSEDAVARASANTFTAGQDITVSVVGNSACLDMNITIKFTRAIGS